LRDFGRFGLFAMNDGERGAEHVLPKDWMREATAGSPTNPRYSFQWWLQPEQHTFEAVGIFGQVIAISPTDQTVVVILSALAQPAMTTIPESTAGEGDEVRINRYLDGVFATIRQNQ